MTFLRPATVAPPQGDARPRRRQEEPAPPCLEHFQKKSLTPALSARIGGRSSELRAPSMPTRSHCPGTPAPLLSFNSLIHARTTPSLREAVRCAVSLPSALGVCARRSRSSSCWW